MNQATSIACDNDQHERCPFPGDCLCDCHDSVTEQDVAEGKADDRLLALKEDGPRHDIDEYDSEDEDRRANEQAIKRGWR